MLTVLPARRRKTAGSQRGDFHEASTVAEASDAVAKQCTSGVYLLTILGQGAACVLTVLVGLL